jgi:predicted double-glycine peptidase
MIRSTWRTFIFILCACCGLSAADTSGIWLDVPFVKQEKDGCGAASISMLMQYWLKQQGTPVQQSADAANIQRTLYSRQAHGIYAADLQKYLEQQGFRTFSFAGNWADLEKHLRKGRPLIVATTPGGPLHYVVLTGLDSERRLIMVNDPARRKLLKWDRATFEKQWSAAGNWTLLAVPQQLSP